MEGINQQIEGARTRLGSLVETPPQAQARLGTGRARAHRAAQSEAGDTASGKSVTSSGVACQWARRRGRGLGDSESDSEAGEASRARLLPVTRSTTVITSSSSS